MEFSSESTFQNFSVTSNFSRHFSQVNHNLLFSYLSQPWEPRVYSGVMLLTTALALAALAVASAATEAYESPEDCDWHPVVDGGDGEAVGLTCHLSAINSNSERTNFSVIPARGTVRLDVR